MGRVEIITPDEETQLLATGTLFGALLPAGTPVAILVTRTVALRIEIKLPEAAKYAKNANTDEERQHD